MRYTHPMKSVVISFEAIDEKTAGISSIPGVIACRLGGANGCKTHASYEDVKNGRFGFRMSAKIDYDERISSIKTLTKHFLAMASEAPLHLYYLDLLDGIEAKAAAEEIGQSERLKVAKCCFFAPLQSRA